jgi:hypothetical protein
MEDTNSVNAKSQESKLLDKDSYRIIPSFNNSSLELDSKEGNILQDAKEAKEEFSKWVDNPLYSEVDFRNFNANNFTFNVNKTIAEYVNYNRSILTHVQEEIGKIIDAVLPKTEYLISNPSAIQDPSKYFVDVYKSSKYIGVGRIIPVDMDEGKVFKQLGLKTKKDIEEKLDLITRFHDAMRTREGVDAAVKNLKEEYFTFLQKGYTNIINELAHSVYWSPMSLELIGVYHNCFASIHPKPHYLLYPLYLKIMSFFNRSLVNASIEIGPPIDLFVKPPFKGNMMVEAKIYFKYENSLFGKFKLIRNGKEY